MTPTSTMEGEPPLVRGGEKAGSTTLTDVLSGIILNRDPQLKEKGLVSATNLTGDFFAQHNIGPARTRTVSDLVGLTKGTVHPELAQATILTSLDTSTQTEGRDNDYLVFKAPRRYGGEDQADDLFVLHVAGKVKEGESAYLTVFRRTYPVSMGVTNTREPYFIISAYDISDDSSYWRYERGTRATGQPTLHVTDKQTHSVHPPIVCKGMLDTYNGANRFLDTLVRDHKEAVALLNEENKEKVVELGDEGFTLLINQPIRLENGRWSKETIRVYFPWDPSQGKPVFGPDYGYSSLMTHAEFNGYSNPGRFKVIALLAHYQSLYARAETQR